MLSRCNNSFRLLFYLVVPFYFLWSANRMKEEFKLKSQVLTIRMKFEDSLPKLQMSPLLHEV